MPESLDAVVLTILSKSPADRFQSCGEVIDALRDAGSRLAAHEAARKNVKWLHECRARSRENVRVNHGVAQVAQLALLVDDVVVKLFPLEKPVVTIGRTADNDIQIDDSGVSARHARIRVKPSALLEGHLDVLVEDLGSTNGTLVNDEQVARCELKPNDVITVGWNRFKLLDDRAQGSETTAHIIRG